MVDINLSLEVNSTKTILSSETRAFKTERFFYQTKKISSIDKFVLKISESIAQILPELKKMYLDNKDGLNSFKVETFDKEYSFVFVCGFQLASSALNENDIVFLSLEKELELIKNNDQRIVQYLKNSRIFKINIRDYIVDDEILDTSKLYTLSENEFVNFPMLSSEQKKLVEIDNQNVLVQGVAGSGKTNVCMSKILWTACRNWTGKILYTTFSRGLLIDTKNKIELFKINIKNFIDDYKNNRIVFLDKNHKTAIENRLGVFLIVDNDSNIIKKLELIVEFLEHHIDYYLLEDLYKIIDNNENTIADEKVFTDKFLKSMNNHQLKSKLSKLKNISLQVIYKEIFGMIFGCIKDENNLEMLTLETYTKKRENSFSKSECEVIYGLAKEYHNYQKTQNLVDNNEISRKLLKNIEKIQKYSLSIIDEVQDFTEINLKLFKEISIKMFAVGDALQMINPSYFSFAFLKKLMFREDVTRVAELESNYRNNKKIVEILDALGDINIKQFGTHSFVLSNKSVDESSMTNVVFTSDESYIQRLKNQKFENFTILVSDKNEKQKLRDVFKKQEILTISEIKGLERDTVLLYNILSSNFDKWQKLFDSFVNHKTADENSVYRYYFNLFYVGISRAKHNLFVFEKQKITFFDEFFTKYFDILSGDETYQKFNEVISKIEIDDDEILDRINEFLKLGQFDNARFYADKFEDGTLSQKQLAKIDAYENFVFKGKNKEAGIALWKAGLPVEAKEQFLISGDNKLIEFVESLEGKNQTMLDASIVNFFVDFEDNIEAQKLILDVLRADLEQIKNSHKDIQNKLKFFKEKK